MPDLSHVSLPVTDSAGNLASAVKVSLLETESQTVPTIDFYNTPEGGNPLTFPVVFRPGIIELWASQPIRVDVIATLPNNATIGYQGVDIAPRADNMLSSPVGLSIDYNDPTQNSALVSTGLKTASFQVIAPTLTHQHQGDSLNSVVLTDEDPDDFSPQQTWIGFQAGVPDSFDTTDATGSVAIGDRTAIGGTFTTVVGNGSVVGDYSTVVSTEGTLANAYSTVVGADNSAGAATYLSVLGSDNTVSAGTNNTVIGSNNTVNTSTSTYVGDLHAASSATNMHTLVGHANKLYPLPVSQVPVRQGFGIGTTAVVANLGSGTDWFGGGSWYATGYNDEASSSQCGMLQGNAVTNLMLQVLGSASLGAQTDTATTSGLLGFYGGTATARAVQSTYPTDTTSASIPALQSLMTALNSLGLIRSVIDTNVSIDTTQTAGRPLEFASTGQAVQWSNPVGSTGYQATNPFVFNGTGVALVTSTAAQQFGVMSCGDTDTFVTASITFDPTATSVQPSGILIRSYLNLSGGHAAIDGLLIAQNGVYPVTNGVLGGSLVGYASLPSTATVTVKSSGTTISVVDITGTPVTKATLTSSYNQTKVKIGFMLSKASTLNSFSASSAF